MYYLTEISQLRNKFYNEHKESSFIDAIETGEKILSLYRENEDTQGKEYSKDSYNLGVVYETLRLYEKALSCYKEAAAVLEKTDGESEDYANAINNEAVCLGALNREAEALSLHKKALSVRESVLGRNHVDCIESLINIGNTYDDMGRLEKALDYLNKALMRAERQKELPRLDYSDILCSLARVLSQKGCFKKAVMNYTKAVDIIEGEMENTPYLMRVLFDAAKCCMEAEKYEMAIVYYKKSIEIRQKVTEGSNVEYIAALNLLATAYAKNKNLEEAVKGYDYTLKKVSEIMDSDHSFYSDVYINKAYAYFISEDYETALRLIETAYNMKTRTLGEENAALCGVLAKLVSVCVKKGDFEKAKAYCEKSLSVALKNGEKKKYTVMAYRNFARLYTAKEDYDKACEYLKKAEETCINDERELERERYLYVLSSLSDVYAKKGEYEKAQKYAGKAVAFCDEKYGCEHPRYAYALYKLAEKMILNGHFTAGITNLEKAMAICKETLGKENDGYKKAEKLLNTTYIGAARFYMEQGDFESAVKSYDKSGSDEKNDIDFAGLLLSLDDTKRAKAVLEKNRDSENSGLYESWLNLKEGGMVEASFLEGYKGIFEAALNYDLALFYEKCGNEDKALTCFEKALKGEKNEKYIKAAAKVYSQKADKEMLKETISLAESKKLDKGEDFVCALESLCVLLIKDESYEEALKYLEKLAVTVSCDSNRAALYADCLVKMGDISKLLGKLEDSAEYLSDASVKIKEIYGEKEEYEKCLLKTGRAYALIEKYESAEMIFEKASALAASLYGGESKRYIEAATELTDIYFAMGKREKALELCEKLYNICAKNKCIDNMKEAHLKSLKESFKDGGKLKILKIKLGKTL